MYLTKLYLPTFYEYIVFHIYDVVNTKKYKIARNVIYENSREIRNRENKYTSKHKVSVHLLFTVEIKQLTVCVNLLTINYKLIIFN